jgi:hypothetical protein
MTTLRNAVLLVLLGLFVGGCCAPEPPIAIRDQNGGFAVAKSTKAFCTSETKQLVPIYIGAYDRFSAKAAECRGNVSCVDSAYAGYSAVTAAADRAYSQCDNLTPIEDFHESLRKAQLILEGY